MSDPTHPGPLVQPQHSWADLHEAKFLKYALGLLPPHLRIRWLRLCCQKASPPGGAPVDVVRSSGEVRSVMFDFTTIRGWNGLTLEWATGLAEHMVRGRLVRDYLGETR